MTRLTTPPLSFDLGAHAPSLQRRQTVRLHPRRGPEPAVDASKLGGAIAWPDGEAWPKCDEHGNEGVGVLQLRRDDVPELGFPADSDFFQLLWCPRNHESAGYAPKAFGHWRRLPIESAQGRVGVPGPDADESYLPNACTLHPERVTEFRSAFELGKHEVARLDELIRERAEADLERLGIPPDDPLYQYHFSTAPGTKVGGFVDWVQDPEVPTCTCGATTEHLLTIASLEYDGSYHRWLPLEERDAWRKLRYASYETRMAIAAPAGLTLGDAGHYYVFVCRRCRELPIYAVQQCS